LYNDNGEVLYKNTIVIVSRLQSASVSASSHKLACGQTVLLTANTVGGSGSYTYKWYHNEVLIEGQTNSTLELTYENEGGLYDVVVKDQGTYLSQFDPEWKYFLNSVTSNKVLIYKEFNVHIVNNAAASTDREVNVNSAINLTAAVEGGDACNVEYQWFMKDCSCNYIYDGSGCRMLIGTSQNLLIQNPAVEIQKLLASGYIVAHASYTNYVQSSDPSDCDCTKVQQVWAMDSIKTVQSVCIQIENKSGLTELFRIHDNSQIRLCPQVCTPGYKLSEATSITWSYAPRPLIDASDERITATQSSPANEYGYVDASNCLVLSRCDTAGQYRVKVDWAISNITGACKATGSALSQVFTATNPYVLTINDLEGTDYVRTNGDSLVDCSGVNALKFSLTFDDDCICLDDNICVKFYWSLKDANGLKQSGNSQEYSLQYLTCNAFEFDISDALIFNSCDNTATLSAYANFYPCNTPACIIGTIKAEPVTLHQILDVKITATNACDPSDVEVDPMTVVLDASGLFLNATVCGENSLISGGSSPVVFQWFRNNVQLTPKSTFSKISVLPGEFGDYRVEVSRIIKSAVDGNEFCSLTLSGRATVKVQAAAQAIEAVAIRPTQRNVVAFSSSGALIDNNSSLGVLRAHVAPEQDDLDFQWFNNEQVILGANDRSYNPGSKPGSYSVRVSNSLGSVVSRNFTITKKN